MWVDLNEMKPIKAATRVNRVAFRSPLSAQSASFWLGAYMVAEAPALLALSLLDSATQERLMDAILGNGWALLVAIVVIVALGLLVGWLAHRLGFGD